MSFVGSATPGGVSIGLILEDELREVQRALTYYTRVKLGGYEFSVRCRAGRRRWQIANDNIVVNIDGGFARFAGTYDVNSALISSCASVGSRPFLSEIMIDGRNVTATYPTGTITMSGGMVDTQFRVIEQSRVVEAKISQGSLHSLAQTCPEIPYESYEKDESGDKFPITTISISDNAVSLSGNCNRYGYNKVTSTVSAITFGHGDITSLSDLLSTTLSVFCFDPKKQGVTIAYDPDGGDFIEFSAETVNIAFRCTRVESNTKLDSQSS